MNQDVKPDTCKRLNVFPSLHRQLTFLSAKVEKSELKSVGFEVGLNMKGRGLKSQEGLTCACQVNLHVKTVYSADINHSRCGTIRALLSAA